MGITLYPYNQETYNKMVTMFQDSYRVGIVQPTGTGKSFIFLKWIEDNEEDRFAVLSPSTEIFTQLQEYAAEAGLPDLLKKAQMISYQALLQMSDEEIMAIRPDKIILDEFHRTGADFWGPSLMRLLNANPTAHTLGASATPVRYLDDCRDMASELFDNNLAAEMTLGEAIVRKILPMPKYIPVWYELNGVFDGYRKDAAKIADPATRKEVEEKIAILQKQLENSYGAAEIFQKHMPTDHGKYIVFCRDVAHIEECKKALPKWLRGINTNVRQYVSISQNIDKDIQLQAFKEDNDDSTIKLLYTVDRLNEGVHVKGIDGVIMLRPTTSPIIYLQQMGRALAVGNEYPLVFDMVNNYSNVQVALKNGETRNVLDFEMRNYCQHEQDKEIFRIFEDMISFTEMFKELETLLYPSWDERWGEWYSLLLSYIAEYGCLPAQKTVYQGKNLGFWVNHQKMLYIQNKLSAERYEKLAKLGVFNKVQFTWDEWHSLLLSYIAENGCLPSRNTVYRDKKLGIWINGQKRRYRQNKMSAEQYEKLARLGVFDKKLDPWDEWHDLLVSHIAEYGCLPTSKTVYRNKKLGRWIYFQKQLYKQSKLSAERYKKLARLGVFDEKTDPWDEWYALLVSHIAEYGCLPTQKTVYHGKRLGVWIKTQRQLYSKNKLSAEQYEKLAQLGVFDSYKPRT